MNLNMGNYSEFLTGLAEPLFKDGFSVSRDIVSKPEYKADPQYNLEVVPGVCWEWRPLVWKACRFLSMP